MNRQVPQNPLYMRMVMAQTLAARKEKKEVV
jgi:hypothetical protein